MPPYRRDMGLVFQSYALFPHMTVAKNVAFGLEMRKRGERRDRRARRGRHSRWSSSAAAWRATAARALRAASSSASRWRARWSSGPSILLLDEPLSNLDAKLRDEMRNEIRDIQQRLGITAIFVTHDQVEALTHVRQGRGDEPGQARADRERRSSSTRQPAPPFVASFVGRTNRARRQWRKGEHGEFADLRIAAPARLTGPVEVMVRPHRIAHRRRTPTRGMAGNQLSRHDHARHLRRRHSAIRCRGRRLDDHRSSWPTRGGETVLAPGTPVTLWLARRGRLIVSERRS